MKFSILPLGTIICFYLEYTDVMWFVVNKRAVCSKPLAIRTSTIKVVQDTFCNWLDMSDRMLIYKFVQWWNVCFLINLNELINVCSSLNVCFLIPHDVNLGDSKTFSFCLFPNKHSPFANFLDQIWQTLFKEPLVILKASKTTDYSH